VESSENAPSSAAATAPPPPARGNLGQRVRSLRLSRVPEQRFSLRPYLAAGLIVALVAIGWYGLSGMRGQPTVTDASATNGSDDAAGPSADGSQGSAATPSARPAAKSKASQPPPGEIALESKGYIVPAHQILVSPKVSGMIIQLDLEEGRRVKKGDILAVLETTDYQADYDRTQAAVKLAREKLRELENGNRPEEIQQAEAELGESQAQLAQLEAEWKRSVDLLKKTSISQQEYELAESQYRAMVQRAERLKAALALLKIGEREERIEMAKADVASSEADLMKAEWRLGNCTIRAPINGTILRKNAEEGNIVNPIAFNGSFSLCEMADLSDLEVELDIQERDISLLSVGQKCRVRAEAWPDRVYDGVVDRLLPIANRSKGAIPVRVKVTIPPEEEGVYLKPEMGAIVTFLNPPPVEKTEKSETADSAALAP
jgi:HlyD family secretion protein